eukprot:TRINITY_DN1638_c0_g4_i1.p1 TRINITY_DN1638_c0_g4~~TRINITY_DN1638_c0_g4_i1.p1  ORF type:complete len:463 (+),score=149.05 TRINITY_DN1638_c0_g4_i1:63-1451(+)
MPWTPQPSFGRIDPAALREAFRSKPAPVSPPSPPSPPSDGDWGSLQPRRLDHDFVSTGRRRRRRSSASARRADGLALAAYSPPTPAGGAHQACARAVAAIRRGLADISQTVRLRVKQALQLLSRVAAAYARDREAWHDLLCSVRAEVSQTAGGVAGEMLRAALLEREEQLRVCKEDKRRLLGIVKQQERRQAELDGAAKLLRDCREKGEKELDTARRSCARARSDRAAAQRKAAVLESKLGQAAELRQEAEEKSVRAHGEIGKAYETARKTVAAELASLREQLRAMREAVARRDAELMRIRAEAAQQEQERAQSTPLRPERAAGTPIWRRSPSPPLRCPLPLATGPKSVRVDLSGPPSGKLFTQLQRASLKALTELARRSPRATSRRGNLAIALQSRHRSLSAPAPHRLSRSATASPRTLPGDGSALGALLQLPRSGGSGVMETSHADDSALPQRSPTRSCP